MHRRRLAAAGVMLILLASPVLAGGIDLPGGWRANWPPPDGSIGIVVDEVTREYIRIQISKDFTDPPEHGIFPPRLIDFIQTEDDAHTVPRIIIADEIISNQTGADWPDFHWQVINGRDAWFNVPLSRSFDVSPYRRKVFSDPFDIFHDPDKATDLDAFDGLVRHRETFFPGVREGDLVIDVDLRASEDPLSFTFKQFPTPEPGTLGLLAAAALFVLRRR
jgi:hypothetical protein